MKYEISITASQSWQYDNLIGVFVLWCSTSSLRTQLSPASTSGRGKTIAGSRWEHRNSFKTNRTCDRKDEEHHQLPQLCGRCWITNQPASPSLPLPPHTPHTTAADRLTQSVRFYLVLPEWSNCCVGIGPSVGISVGTSVGITDDIWGEISVNTAGLPWLGWGDALTLSAIS